MKIEQDYNNYKQQSENDKTFKHNPKNRAYTHEK